MGMTITEKILSHAGGKKHVSPGEIVTITYNWLMSNDATTHVSINMWKNKVKNPRIFDPGKIVFVIDHNVPAENVKTADTQKLMRIFAREHNLQLYDGEGVCHQLLMENHTLPGQVVIGADSHTTTAGAYGAFGSGFGSTDIVAALHEGTIWVKVPETIKFEISGKLKSYVTAKDLILKMIQYLGAKGATYKTMEITGDAVKDFSVEERITLTNLAIEAGAKNGIIEADRKVIDYIKGIRGEPLPEYTIFKSDPDAEYRQTFTINLDELEPMVAFPHTLDNVKPLKDAVGTKVDEVFIGSCSNGRIEDLRIAAHVLAGKKVHRSTRLLISPASRRVFKQALDEGLILTFVKAGALVLNPNCSVCWGACQGVIGKDEVLLSTGTRNFRGRAGSPESKIFLCSPRTAAVSAVTGKITHPGEFE
ncbi:MAG: 3-isopropylmalate dehydratase large subunit [Spirochaetales bacterium]|nr:3-isopropylmalate dehydratase large subunit [Spirochaetales bacterium]